MGVVLQKPLRVRGTRATRCGLLGGTARLCLLSVLAKAASADCWRIHFKPLKSQKSFIVLRLQARATCDVHAKTGKLSERLGERLGIYRAAIVQVTPLSLDALSTLFYSRLLYVSDHFSWYAQAL